MLPEKGWHDQPKYCYEKAIHVVMISLVSQRAMSEEKRLPFAGYVTISFAVVFEVLDSFIVLMILAG